MTDATTLPLLERLRRWWHRQRHGSSSSPADALDGCDFSPLVRRWRAGERIPWTRDDQLEQLLVRLADRELPADQRPLRREDRR
jgi:hypothetical protein